MDLKPGNGNDWKQQCFMGELLKQHFKLKINKSVMSNNSE